MTQWPLRVLILPLSDDTEHLSDDVPYELLDLIGRKAHFVSKNGGLPE